MSNLSYQEFLKRVGEKKYQPIYERKMLRRGLRNLYGLQRQGQRTSIEERFKAINRSANKNAKEAIKTARTASNESHKAHMLAIKAWAEYATTPATNHPFNKDNYKKFRKYYISELNRLALSRGNEWKSGGVRLSEFFRRQKNKAANFRKRSAENFRRAKQAAENAKRATAKAASLKALGAKQLFNNSRARVTASGFRKAANAATERARVQGKINAFKAKAATLRQQSQALNAAGNASTAAAIAAQANAAAAAAAALAASTSSTGTVRLPRPNNNNDEFFNTQTNFNNALLSNNINKELLRIVKNNRVNLSQREKAKQNLIAKHPELIFLNNKLIRKSTRRGGLAAQISTTM